MTYAKVIADSVNIHGHRITTMEVRFHRFVLAEFNTHRVFSRNSASSRAIPLLKQLRKMDENGPAVPVSWPRDKAGMQGGEEIEDYMKEVIEETWLTTARLSAKTAAVLNQCGLHKSVVNRILEPFMWHTVIVTATAWENFFEQRCSPLAQPEIRLAAEMMRDAYHASTPKVLKDGQWHTPYVQEADIERLAGDNLSSVDYQLKVSAARCARVSYLTHTGERDVYKDIELFDKLSQAKPPHWSPMEHVATPWLSNVQGDLISFTDRHGNPLILHTRHLPRVGNLLGWRSLRTEVEASRKENTYR